LKMYSPPSWSCLPFKQYSIDVSKNGQFIETIEVDQPFLTIG